MEQPFTEAMEIILNYHQMELLLLLQLVAGVHELMILRQEWQQNLALVQMVDPAVEHRIEMG